MDSINIYNQENGTDLFIDCSTVVTNQPISEYMYNVYGVITPNYNNTAITALAIANTLTVLVRAAELVRGVGVGVGAADGVAVPRL